jgi:hypothetical protein
VNSDARQRGAGPVSRDPQANVEWVVTRRLLLDSARRVALCLRVVRLQLRRVRAPAGAPASPWRDRPNGHQICFPSRRLGLNRPSCFARAPAGEPIAAWYPLESMRADELLDRLQRGAFSASTRPIWTTALSPILRAVARRQHRRRRVRPVGSGRGRRARLARCLPDERVGSAGVYREGISKNGNGPVVEWLSMLNFPSFSNV